eukprot:8009508-Alexandrium_andersonii.AAC.1
MPGTPMILLAPARRIAQQAPAATLALVADDRAAAANTGGAMAQVKQIWRLLERATFLFNGAPKQKDWSYVPAAVGAPAKLGGTAPAALGMGLPAPARAATREEIEAVHSAVGQHRRAGRLPFPGAARRIAATMGPASSTTWARICRPFTRLE